MVSVFVFGFSMIGFCVVWVVLFMVMFLICMLGVGLSFGRCCGFMIIRLLEEGSYSWLVVLRVLVVWSLLVKVVLCKVLLGLKLVECMCVRCFCVKLLSLVCDMW